MRTSSRLKLMTVFSLFLIFAIGLTVFRFVSIPTHAAGTKASIALSLTYGPPTSVVGVSGKGFKGSETVTLSFDSTQIKSVKASKTGSFSATITVPSSALPGNHFVQGRGSSSGFFAQTTFVSQLTQKWVFPLGGDNVGPPAVAQSTIYTTCNELDLCAVATATGQLIWNHTTEGRTDSGTTPAIVNGLVYIGSTEGDFNALSTATGQLIWRYETGYTINDSPLTANGLVYIGASNGVLYAFNSTTGRIAWKHAFQGIFSTPSIDNGTIYVSSGGSLYALNAQTGVQKWHVSSIENTPVIANNIVYSRNPANGNLTALNAQTGALLWSKNIAAISDPAVANGMVYIAAGCNFDALSATTGTLLWNDDTTDSGLCIESTPTIANGVIYVGGSNSDPGDGLLFTYNATTGAGLGAMSINIGIVSDLPTQPVVINGTVYCATQGSLYTYHL